jgi:molybdenum cofactor biosynthesis enzyme MoaA
MKNCNLTCESCHEAVSSSLPLQITTESIYNVQRVLYVILGYENVKTNGCCINEKTFVNN